MEMHVDILPAQCPNSGLAAVSALDCASPRLGSGQPLSKNKKAPSEEGPEVLHGVHRRRSTGPRHVRVRLSRHCATNQAAAGGEAAEHSMLLRANLSSGNKYVDLLDE